MVMVDRLWAKTGIMREVMLVLAGIMLVGLAARIQIPLFPVPVTGQTFAVLLVGALYGARRGSLTVAGYVAGGTAGLPLFAGGEAGPARLLGPTGGYLVGFVAAAWLVGKLCEAGWDRRVWTSGAAMLIGTLVIYLFGLLWLARFVEPSEVIPLGLAPFVIGDGLKVALAAVTLPFGWRLVGRT